MSYLISIIAIVSRHVSFHQDFVKVIKWVQWNEPIHMVFATEVFFEVAIEKRPEWDSLLTINEFHLDTVTDWAIKPWVQVALRANFVELLQWDRLFRVIFHFGHCLDQSPYFFSLEFSWGNHMSVAEWADTYGFTTKIFFEVAIESTLEWDLNPQPLNSFQMLQPTELLGRELNSDSEPTFYSYSNCIICSMSYFILAIAFVRRHVCFHQHFLEVITWVQRKELVHMVLTTAGFLEIGTESWTEWGLNLPSMNSVQRL